MTGRKKANKHEAGWPADTVALAHAARPQLFNSLHSLKATEVKSADTERYERLFAQAEALLDGTQSHKLLSTAQEHLLRAGEPPKAVSWRWSRNPRVERNCWRR
jgi:hypothetical protein